VMLFVWMVNLPVDGNFCMPATRLSFIADAG